MSKQTKINAQLEQMRLFDLYKRKLMELQNWSTQDTSELRDIYNKLDIRYRVKAEQSFKYRFGVADAIATFSGDELNLIFRAKGGDPRVKFLGDRFVENEKYSIFT